MHGGFFEGDRLRARARAGRLGVVFVLLVALVMGVLTSAAPKAAAADIGMSKPVYGANEAVIVAVGMTDYVRNCTQIDGAGIPVNDWLYAVSDLYVVPSTWNGGGLSDVSGEPNVVFGQIGGAFIDEVIGYTSPGGSIPPGRYGVVIDNCQDKHFDPAIDTFIPDAFRVTSDVLVPPLDIAAIKADAGQRAASWMDAEYAFTGLTFAANAWELWGAMTDPADMLIFMVTDAFVRQAGLPDAKAEARNLLLSTARHWGGIAADPPNYAYDVPVSPGAVPTLESNDANPVLRSEVALGQQSAIEGSLARALLESIEKYQGAARDRNGVWARQHARAAQRYARALAAQLPASAAATSQAAADLRGDTSDVDTVMSSIGNLLIDARTNGISADVRRKAASLGISNDDLNAGLRAIDNLGMAGITKASLAASLDELVVQAPAATNKLLGLANDLNAIIAQLDADPLMTSDFVTADAGGPYTAATGSAVTLNASASTGTGTLAYAWDLDGDGVFDDANGPTPTFMVSADAPMLVSVKVTGIDGIADLATATFTNTTTSTAPRITARTPTTGVADIEGGNTLALSVAPTAPGGSPTTTWWVNAVQQGTGTSFDLVTAPGDYGSRQVTAIVTDAAGQMTSTTWWVRVGGVDADNDGWPVPLDCNDANPAINPGMPDIANGIDDDCDPNTSDGTPAPTVEITSIDTALEGAEYLLTGAITSGPGASNVTATWGDGTTSTMGTGLISLGHTYVDDGTYVVELCAKNPTSPWGCTFQELTVANQAPNVNFVDLTTWIVVDKKMESYLSKQGPSLWEVADSRDSVLQVQNSDPAVFLSPDSYVDVEATVQMTSENAWDDDFIGFVIGGSPDMFTSDDADYLLIDWKMGDQGVTKGTRVSRVHGAVNANELWFHTEDTYYVTDGTITQLASGINYGSAPYVSNQTYEITFRYTPQRLQVWINGELEFDLTGDFPTDARFGFYNYSQDHVRYRNFAQSGITVDEGSLADFPGYYVDPGVRDTHSGLFSWGDGSAADRVTLSSVDGDGTASASHGYVDDGTYASKLCVTDNADGTGCQVRNVYVRNVAPVVDAGRDRVAGPSLVLDDSTFTDVGVLDTHTATVTWGDGSPVEDAVVSGDRGSGIVAAAHTYDTDGTFTVEVCVTDDDTGVGCDTFEVEMRAVNGALASVAEEDASVPEGTLIQRQVAFEDVNPTDAHTATIDWGDGTTGPMIVADGGSVGVGTATHRYADDGVHNVKASVCDDRGSCTIAPSVVTVTNVAPTVDASEGGTVTAGEPFTFTGTYGDPGTADTHTGTAHWGDGTSGEFTPVTDATPGTGTFGAAHTFTAAGDHTVELCVADDDGASTCVERRVTVNAAAVDPPTDPPLDPPAPTATPASPATVPSPPTATTTPPGINRIALASEKPGPEQPTDTSALAFTGASVIRFGVLGLLLAAAGTLLLLATKRRRHHPQR